MILFIGDGMGPVHEDLGSRWVHGRPDALRMQAAPHRSMVATRCLDREITDSAAAATAMSTGQLVNYEAVAVTPDGTPIETVAEELIEAGISVGMVTTSRLTHATPASYLAHVPRRYDEDVIAPQMLAQGAELLFGGGGPGMTPATLQAAGYAVATNAAEMASLDGDAEAWATLIGRSHLPYVADGLGDAPTLAAMTDRALTLLESRGRFFLMVEGARIDHASHNNDIARMLPEMAGFDDAIGVALAWASDRDDTLIMVTADHECGGLSVVSHAAAGELPEVAWSTGGHTGVPVSLYGWGPFGHAVEGVDANTDIYWLSRWMLSATPAATQ